MKPVTYEQLREDHPELNLMPWEYLHWLDRKLVGSVSYEELYALRVFKFMSREAPVDPSFERCSGMAPYPPPEDRNRREEYTQAMREITTFRASKRERKSHGKSKHERS